MRKQFGGKITKTHIEKYSKSKNWDGKIFLNLEETKLEFNFHSIPKLLYKQFCQKEEREPKTKLPIIAFDNASFFSPSENVKFIWYGHSVVLLRVNNKTILIDPMLGGNAAPISPFSVNRFSENTLDIIDELPEIDLLLLTHDHYDHLDYDSIMNLKHKVKQYYVSLGTARHLVKWGIDETLITEFDWWEESIFADINITFTPTRHFAGRGLSDRAKSLWGGWAIKTNQYNIWFSGDGGYGKHFKEIGNKLGGFDFAFIECGQYNENWHSIHMYPEEAVMAGIEAKAKNSMPVHWAGFALAQHSWTEPIERYIAESKKQKLDYITPQIGELIELNKKHNNIEWWK